MEHLIINLRMKIAAIKQFLQDSKESLTQEETDELLDELAKRLELLKII